MQAYKIMFFTNANHSERTIRAKTLRHAKLIASRLFPTRGRWQRCYSFDSKTRKWYANNQHLKTVDILNGDRLYLMPIYDKGDTQ
ncbi:MAG: hypothetical protein OXM61_17360 [Candidatus Poribacteria bacterium]|nr:hypothetical protein [Candidatus Poribacteria bacterium]